MGEGEWGQLDCDSRGKKEVRQVVEAVVLDPAVPSLTPSLTQSVEVTLKNNTKEALGDGSL
jgi:hypothetical protein